MTKVTVRIHHDDNSVTWKTKKIDDDDTVLLAKRTKFEREWRPKITWKETKNLMFGRVKYFTDILPGALETIQLNARDKTIIRPELDQKEVTRYAKSKVFEKRYMTDQKPVNSMLLYVILMIQIVSIVIMFLLTSGRLRI